MTTDAPGPADMASSDLVLVIDDSAAFRIELECALARAGFATVGRRRIEGVESLDLSYAREPAVARRP